MQAPHTGALRAGVYFLRLGMGDCIVSRSVFGGLARPRREVSGMASDFKTVLGEMVDGFRAMKEKLAFFDSSCWLGRPAVPEFLTVDTVDGLLTQMARFRIQRAVVSHMASRDYDPTVGNEMLLDGIRGADDLFGAVTLVPSATGEQGDPGVYLDRCIQGKARLARLFPTLHRFSLGEWCCGDVLTAMQERRIPLLIWHSETSWDTLFSLAVKYPELPIIVEGTEGTGRKILYFNRFYYALLEKTRNVSIELHYTYNFLLLEDMVGKFGAERLVFGSYLPVQDPNATMMRITHARISDDDKKSIAGGNLERLVGRVVT